MVIKFFFLFFLLRPDIPFLGKFGLTNQLKAEISAEISYLDSLEYAESNGDVYFFCL